MTTFEEYESENNKPVELANGSELHDVGVAGISPLIYDFSDFGEVLVKITVRPLDRIAAPLSVVVERSADRESWSAVDTLSFSRAGTQFVTDSSPSVFLRARRASGTGTWRFDIVAVRKTAAGEISGGGLPEGWTQSGDPADVSTHGGDIDLTEGPGGGKLFSFGADVGQQPIENVAEGVNPSDAATVSQIGGSLPEGWTQDDDPTPGAVHAKTALEASPVHDVDTVALRIRKNTDGGGDFVEMVFTDEFGTDWVKTYNHSSWMLGDDGSVVFAFQDTNVQNWVATQRVRSDRSVFAVPAAATALVLGATEAQMAWGVKNAGQEFLNVVAAAVDDDVLTSQRVQWYDDTAGTPRLLFKQRDSVDALFTGKAAAMSEDGTTFRGVTKPDLPADPTNAELATVLSTLGLVNLT